MQRVLIVDDHLEIRLIFSRFLRDAGYEVSNATNGEEALTMLAESKPDLILLDVFMPVMNGAEFLERIRKNPDYEQTPVVLLSAVPDSPEAKYAESLGVSRFLRKGDFDLAQLGVVVTETIRPGTNGHH